MKLYILIWIARVSKIICCLSLLLIPTITNACGPDFSNYYLTYLLEHYQIDNRYYNLQFDPEYKYYSKGAIGMDTEIDTKKQNIFAWKKTLNISSSSQDSLFTNALYNSNTNDEFLNKLNECNEYKKAIINNISITKYFENLFIYKNNYAPNNNDWDYGKYTKSLPLETINTFCNQLQLLINTTENNQLQLRYLYLLLRTAHLNGHFQTTINMYEKNKQLCTNKNILEQMWCEGIVGGAFIRANQQAQGIYHTARAFSKSDDKYRDAISTYNSSNKNWKGALAYSKNASDSIAILLLHTCQNPAPDIMMLQTIYNINPADDAIQLLWLREANKLETYLLNVKDDDYKLYTSNADDLINMTAFIKKNNYTKQFVALGTKMLANPNTAHKATIANMLAYYAYRIKQYDIAKKYASIAESANPNDIEKQQTTILSFITKMHETQSIDNQSIIALCQKNKNSPKYSLQSHMIHYLLYNEITPQYLQNKDTISAYWCYAFCSSLDIDSTGIYMGDYSPESWNTSTFGTYLLLHKLGIAAIEKLEKQYTSKKSNQEFITYCIANTQFINDIKCFAEIKAKKYMMMQQWDKALELLPQLPASYTAIKTMNPANIDFDDVINYTAKMETARTFSVEKILLLASTLKKNADKKIAKDQYLYGVLLYNLSYYGKAHKIVDNHFSHSNYNASSYYKTDNVSVYFYKNEKQYNTQKMSALFYNYFYCTDAEAYLHKALANLQTPEEKANCTWMLAKCWQKRCPIKIDRSKDNNYNSLLSNYVFNSLRNPYLLQLKTQFATTQSYTNAVGSCDYLKMYITRR